MRRYEMDYIRALEYIHGTLKFGSKLGLENITHLLSRLGNPHRKFRVVHVAGTNGKGSVTAMIANMLHAGGYKVGMFVSPYLERFTERIQVDMEEIPEGELGRITGIVREQVDNMLAEGKNHPTEFEIVTAIGFYYFASCGVDYAVVEVGLGGRMDSTNVVEPEVSVITSISYDHMDILGETLSQIAFEKGGIIKEGKPVVSYPQSEEAGRLLRELAAQRHAPFHQVLPGQVALKYSCFEQQNFDFEFGDTVYSDIVIKLPGVHQLLNAATALAAITVLKEGGLRLESRAVYEGMARTRWPGRMEKLGDNPLIILDGAHNISGAGVLRDALERYFPGRRIHMVFGMLNDKDVESVAGILCPSAHRIIITRPMNLGQIYSPGSMLIIRGIKILSTFPIKSMTCP
jgi:dihydrofolate synthase/folylpolyglutamate synthase